MFSHGSQPNVFQNFLNASLDAHGTYPPGTIDMKSVVSMFVRYSPEPRSTYVYLQRGHA